MNPATDSNTDDYNDDSASVPSVMDVDAIRSTQIDHEDAAATRRDLLSPRGNYRTVPALTETYDVHPETGRPQVRFYGPAVLTKDESVTGRFDFSISHVRANKLDFNTGQDTGKPDTRSRLWTQALDMYRKTYGEKPKQVEQVVEFLRDYPIMLNVIQVGVPTESNPEPEGTPRNVVMNISLPKD